MKIFKTQLGFIPQSALVATAVVGLLAALGVALTGALPDGVRMSLVTDVGDYILVGEEFTVAIEVATNVPTNVYAGEVHFDSKIFTVKSIDYNTSIANLWAEEPWYSNGDGTVNFAGGTTAEGGFVGSDNILHITFKTLKAGAGEIGLKDAHILLYDGLGTDAKLAPRKPIVIGSQPQQTQLNARPISKDTSVSVREDAPSYDLNNDGKVSLGDVSMFMANLKSSDKRFDLNADGKIGLRDLNMLLGKLGQ